MEANTIQTTVRIPIELLDGLDALKTRIRRSSGWIPTRAALLRLAVEELLKAEFNFDGSESLEEMRQRIRERINASAPVKKGKAA